MCTNLAASDNFFSLCELVHQSTKIVQHTPQEDATSGKRTSFVSSGRAMYDFQETDMQIQNAKKICSSCSERISLIQYEEAVKKARRLLTFYGEWDDSHTSAIHSIEHMSFSLSTPIVFFLSAELYIYLY